jgi:cell division protein FtsB
VFFTTFVKERFWSIVLLMAVLYFVFLIRADLISNSHLKDEKAAIAKNLDAEKARQAALKRELRMLNSNSHIEMLAREGLGVVRQGEKAYKVIIK